MRRHCQGTWQEAVRQSDGPVSFRHQMYRMPAERVTHPKSAMSTIIRSILPPPPISLRIILRALYTGNS